METFDLTGDDEIPAGGYAPNLALGAVVDLSAIADGDVDVDSGNSTELDYSEDEDDDDEAGSYAGATSGSSVRCNATKNRGVHSNGDKDVNAAVRKRKRVDTHQVVDKAMRTEPAKSAPLASTKASAAAVAAAVSAVCQNGNNTIANKSTNGMPNSSKEKSGNVNGATKDSTLSAAERQAQMRQKFRDAKAREAASSGDAVARFTQVPEAASKALKVSSIATGPCRRTSLDPAMAALAAARRRRGWNDTLSTIERRRSGDHDKALITEAATAAPAPSAAAPTTVTVAPATAASTAPVVAAQVEAPPRVSQETNVSMRSRPRSSVDGNTGAAAVRTAPTKASPPPRVTPETSFVDSSDDDDDILEILEMQQPSFHSSRRYTSSHMVDAAMAVLDVVFAGSSNSSSNSRGSVGSGSTTNSSSSSRNSRSSSSSSSIVVGNSRSGSDIDGARREKSSASVNQSLDNPTMDLSKEDDDAQRGETVPDAPEPQGTKQRKCSPKFPPSKCPATSLPSPSSLSHPQSSSSSPSSSLPQPSSSSTSSSSSSSSSSFSSSSSSSTAPLPAQPTRSSSPTLDAKPKPTQSASTSNSTKPKCKTCVTTGDRYPRSLCDACLRCYSHCKCGTGGKPNCACKLCEKRLYLYLKRTQMRSYSAFERAQLERQRGIEQDKLLREAKERFMQQAVNPADPFGSSSYAQGQPHYTPEFRGNGRFNKGNNSGRQHRQSNQAHYTASSSSSGSSSSTSHTSGPSQSSSGSPHWMSADPFVCLKLSNRSAQLAEIKAQYRRLCLLYHPDKSTHPEATEAFIAISRAYRELSNQP